jgi:hypothetical protein
MATLKNHWITTLTLIAAGLMALFGVGVVFGNDGIEASRNDGIQAWRVVYMAGSLMGALAILGGLWGLRTGSFRVGVANALVICGLVAFAVGYWWMVFVPLVVALTLVYVGVIRHGLEQELRPV